MTTKEKLQKLYEEYQSIRDGEATVYEWAASWIFDLATYDGDLDELFVKEIVRVSEVIINDENFDFIKQQENYIKYILVCQLLYRFDWIEWGTSIRGAWINYSAKRCIYKDYDDELTIPFTAENYKELIEFIKDKEVSE